MALDAAVREGVCRQRVYTTTRPNAWQRGSYTLARSVRCLLRIPGVCGCGYRGFVQNLFDHHRVFDLFPLHPSL